MARQRAAGLDGVQARDAETGTSTGMSRRATTLAASPAIQYHATALARGRPSPTNPRIRRLAGATCQCDVPAPWSASLRLGISLATAVEPLPRRPAAPGPSDRVGETGRAPDDRASRAAIVAVPSITHRPRCEPIKDDIHGIEVHLRGTRYLPWFYRDPRDGEVEKFFPAMQAHHYPSRMVGKQP
jgi:hypothetical protein